MLSWDEVKGYMWILALGSMAACGISMMWNGYSDRTDKRMLPVLNLMGKNWWPIRKKREMWKLLAWVPAAALYVMAFILYLVLLPLMELFLWWRELPD